MNATTNTAAKESNMSKSTNHIGIAYNGLYEVCRATGSTLPQYYIAPLAIIGRDNAPVPFFDGCPDTYRKGGWYTDNLPEMD